MQESESKNIVAKKDFLDYHQGRGVWKPSHKSEGIDENDEKYTPENLKSNPVLG